MAKDITIQADRIDLIQRSVGYNAKAELEITLDSADERSVLDNFTVEEIAEHFSDELVEYIKKENNLVEEE